MTIREELSDIYAIRVGLANYSEEHPYGLTVEERPYDQYRVEFKDRYIGTDKKNDIRHFIVLLGYAVKLCGLELNEDNVEELYFLFRMCQSKLAYSSIQPVDKAVEDKYIAKYELPEDVKKLAYTYTVMNITTVYKDVGQDNEGCTYNSLSLRQI